jgi:hypothetical protein
MRQLGAPGRPPLARVQAGWRAHGGRPLTGRQPVVQARRSLIDEPQLLFQPLRGAGCAVGRAGQSGTQRPAQRPGQRRNMALQHRRPGAVAQVGCGDRRARWTRLRGEDSSQFPLALLERQVARARGGRRPGDHLGELTTGVVHSAGQLVDVLGVVERVGPCRDTGRQRRADRGDLGAQIEVVAGVDVRRVRAAGAAQIRLIGTCGWWTGRAAADRSYHDDPSGVLRAATAVSTSASARAGV